MESFGGEEEIPDHGIAHAENNPRVSLSYT